MIQGTRSIKVVNLFAGIGAIEKAISNAILDALLEERAVLAAECEDEMERHIRKLLELHEELRRLMRRMLKTLSKAAALIKAMEMRRAHASGRQTIGCSLSDMMALTIPVPPTK